MAAVTCDLSTLHTSVYSRFLLRNTSMFTISGFRQDLRHVPMFPPELKTHSDGELVAGTQRYFFATLLRVGKCA